ncbi:hypothetical protein JCM8202_003879 [Rhodotorula sphaerocarpa]
MPPSHVDSAAALQSGADNEAEAASTLRRRRRRERSVSSDASDAYIEQLLRPNLQPFKTGELKASTVPPTGVDDDVDGHKTFTADPTASGHAADEHDPVRQTREDGNARPEEQEAEPTPRAEPGEEKQCRICFGGPDEAPEDAEDGQDGASAELGKLFSPCLCRGTSRYVHTGCLEAWRKAAPNERAFWECQQCGYQYRLRRTSLARLVTSPLTVTFLTLVFFLLLVFLAGFLANSLLAVVEQRAASSAGMLDDWFVSDHVLVGEGVREAVAFVSHQLEESSLIAGRQLALDRMARGSADASDASYSYIGSFFGRRTPVAAEAESLANAPFWARAILHFTKGSALVGIVSVFYSFVATTLVTPIGRTLFRALRPGGGRRRGPTGAGSISQLVIVTLVVVGIIKSVRQVYRGVKWLTKLVLSRVEDLVIEVPAT